MLNKKIAIIATIAVSVIVVGFLLCGSVDGKTKMVNNIQMECVNDIPRAYADEIPKENKQIKKKQVKKKRTTAKNKSKISKCSKISGRYFKRIGVIRKNGKRYTWYSSRVLRHYKTRQWYVDRQGFYHTKKGYLVCASRDYKKGKIINTPFGKAQVLDYCPVRNVVDMYVNF